MKKILTTAITFAAIVGCSTGQTQLNGKHVFQKVFYGDLNKEYKVYSDDFKTYKLEITTEKGKVLSVYDLKHQESDSGIMLSNKEEKITLLFKDKGPAQLEIGRYFEKLSENPVNYKLVKKFYLINGTHAYDLFTSDSLNTAYLVSSDKVIKLKRTISASGIILKNEAEKITLSYKNGKFAILEVNSDYIDLFEEKIELNSYTFGDDEVFLAKVNDDEIIFSKDKKSYSLLLKYDPNLNNWISKDGTIELNIKDNKFKLIYRK